MGLSLPQAIVAPLVGAWIEIEQSKALKEELESLPSWERGLKLHTGENEERRQQSLPSWERGLKLTCLVNAWAVIPSLPSWERGLKFL